MAKLLISWIPAVIIMTTCSCSKGNEFNESGFRKDFTDNSAFYESLKNEIIEQKNIKAIKCGSPPRDFDYIRKPATGDHQAYMRISEKCKESKVDYFRINFSLSTIGRENFSIEFMPAHRFLSNPAKIYTFTYYFNSDAAEAIQRGNISMKNCNMIWSLNKEGWYLSYRNDTSDCHDK